MRAVSKHSPLTITGAIVSQGEGFSRLVPMMKMPSLNAASACSQVWCVPQNPISSWAPVYPASKALVITVGSLESSFIIWDAKGG